jgi:hypothetical protein
MTSNKILKFSLQWPIYPFKRGTAPFIISIGVGRFIFLEEGGWAAHPSHSCTPDPRAVHIELPFFLY